MASRILTVLILMAALIAGSFLVVISCEIVGVACEFMPTYVGVSLLLGILLLVVLLVLLIDELFNTLLDL